MTIAITRLDLSAADLREAAARTEDAKAARRMLAIGLVLEDWSREAAAEACAMDRQTVRDWVAELVEQGPAYERDGVVCWRSVVLQLRIAQEFGVPLHERTAGKLLRTLSFRRLSVRPQQARGTSGFQRSFGDLVTAALPAGVCGKPVEIGSPTRPGSVSRAR